MMTKTSSCCSVQLAPHPKRKQQKQEKKRKGKAFRHQFNIKYINEKPSIVPVPGCPATTAVTTSAGTKAATQATLESYTITQVTHL